MLAAQGQITPISDHLHALVHVNNKIITFAILLSKNAPSSSVRFTWHFQPAATQRIHPAFGYNMRALLSPLVFTLCL